MQAPFLVCGWYGKSCERRKILLFPVRPIFVKRAAAFNKPVAKKKLMTFLRTEKYNIKDNRQTQRNSSD
jgi:hypothetical protein